MSVRKDSDTEAAEGGVIMNPRWPDGCPLTINELAHADWGHIDCEKRVFA